MRVSARSLYAAAAACTLAGLGLRVAPAPLPRATVPNERAAAAAAPAVAEGAPEDAGAYARVVDANVFSPRREPPRTRFTPAADEADSAAAAEHEPPAPAEPELRLLGIARDETNAFALIDADPDVPGAETYRLGERAGNGRITAITDSTVVVARPSGRLVLRLPAAVRAPR